MISVVICSQNALYRDLISNNIRETIGVPHEIRIVDNTKGTYSLCEAYNKGASESIYGVLCFVHEDVIFHTQNWGRITIDTLNDESIGLIGVAGGVYKCLAPSSYWTSDKFLVKNVIQHFPKAETKHLFENFGDKTIYDVTALDGVWLSCKKDVWASNKFDEREFNGFHFYDVDFSFQIYQTKRVCAISNILIEHFSNGNINKDWYTSAIKFSKKWEQKLPASTVSLSIKQKKKLERDAYERFLKGLLEINYNKSSTIWQLLKFLRTGILDWKTQMAFRSLLQELLLNLY